jgi:hypothetical protein
MATRFESGQSWILAWLSATRVMNERISIVADPYWTAVSAQLLPVE